MFTIPMSALNNALNGLAKVIPNKPRLPGLIPTHRKILPAKNPQTTHVKETSMFFEVYLKLDDQGGHEIGRSYEQVRAGDPFNAAVVAEERSDALYAGKILAHAYKVNRIPAAQIAVPAAA
jgi:hypothetical protein